MGTWSDFKSWGKRNIVEPVKDVARDARDLALNTGIGDTIIGRAIDLPKEGLRYSAPNAVNVERGDLGNKPGEALTIKGVRETGEREQKVARLTEEVMTELAAVGADVAAPGVGGRVVKAVKLGALGNNTEDGIQKAGVTDYAIAMIKVPGLSQVPGLGVGGKKLMEAGSKKLSEPTKKLLEKGVKFAVGKLDKKIEDEIHALAKAQGPAAEARISAMLNDFNGQPVGEERNEAMANILHELTAEDKNRDLAAKIIEGSAAVAPEPAVFVSAVITNDGAERTATHEPKKSMGDLFQEQAKLLKEFKAAEDAGKLQEAQEKLDAAKALRKPIGEKIAEMDKRNGPPTDEEMKIKAYHQASEAEFAKEQTKLNDLKAAKERQAQTPPSTGFPLLDMLIALITGLQNAGVIKEPVSKGEAKGPSSTSVAAGAEKPSTAAPGSTPTPASELKDSPAKDTVTPADSVKPSPTAAGEAKGPGSAGFTAGSAKPSPDAPASPKPQQPTKQDQFAQPGHQRPPGNAPKQAVSKPAPKTPADEFKNAAKEITTALKDPNNYTHASEVLSNITNKFSEIYEKTENKMAGANNLRAAEILKDPTQKEAVTKFLKKNEGIVKKLASEDPAIQQAAFSQVIGGLSGQKIAGVVPFVDKPILATAQTAKPAANAAPAVAENMGAAAAAALTGNMRAAMDAFAKLGAAAQMDLKGAQALMSKPIAVNVDQPLQVVSATAVATNVTKGGPSMG